MGKIIEIQYNGELGYYSKISQVRAFFKIGLSDEEFLDLKNEETKKSNRELIFENYSSETKISLNLADKEGNDIKTYKEVNPSMPCPVPIILYVDSENISPDILISQSNILANNFSVQSFSKENGEKSFNVNDKKFFNEILRENIRIEDNFQSKFKDGLGLGERENIKPTIWVWCKSLNEDGEFNSNSIFNLTPFVENVNISQTENGGTFSIDLVSIKGIFDLDENDEPVGVWKPNKKSYVKFKDKGQENFMFRNIIDRIGSRKNEDYRNLTFGEREQSVSVNGLNSRDRKFKNGGFKNYNRSEILFKNMISENDVVFISFSNYSSLGVKTSNDFFINNSFLPRKDWQMIGLVDSNKLVTTYESSTVSLQVTGRDLTKLLIEDGSYFFAKSFADTDSGNTAFGNVDLKNRGDDNNAENIRTQKNGGENINRLISNGMISVLFNPEARNVHFIMNLLMSTLSNIEICYDDLFQYYGERRSEFTITSFEKVETGSDSETDNLD